MTAGRVIALAAGLALAAVPGVSPLHGAEPGDKVVVGDESGKVDAAVASGLSFLARHQERDGAFGGGGPRVALTALATMALLSDGHAPDAGRYGLVVRRAVDFLVGQVPEDGYIGKIDGSRMYGHAIVTLALSEACGVDPDPASRRRIRNALERMVDVILKAQDVDKAAVHAGGWRYEPQSPDSDLSLSGWNALALRAAQDVGVAVPKEKVDRAVQYVLKCYRKDDAGFAYQPGNGASVSMTGVAALSLYLLDGTERPELSAATRFLVDQPVAEGTRFAYYALYHGTQAAHQAGGDVWTAVWVNNRDLLLAVQMPDGGWPQSRTGEEPGRVYATSMAVLTLGVPYRLMPIYQR